MADRRMPLLAVGGVVGLLAVIGCAVALAAAAGPGDLLTGSGRGRGAPHHAAPTAPAHASVAAAAPGRHAPTTTPEAHHLPGWLEQTLWVLALVGMVVLLAVAMRALRRYLRVGEPDAEAPPEPDFDPLDDLEWVARQLAAGAAEQRAVLLEGPPRDAVVACWERFEELLTEAGVPRRPWETSTEFTVRVLAAVDAEPHGVHRLAALYREARFSDHLIGEEHRSQALEELASIHAWLAIVTDASSEVTR